MSGNYYHVSERIICTLTTGDGEVYEYTHAFMVHGTVGPKEAVEAAKARLEEEHPDRVFIVEPL